MGSKYRLHLTGVTLLASLLCAAAGLPVHGVSANLEQQRRDYAAAVQALRAGDLDEFRQLYGRLDGYILQGYLQYDFLQDRIATTPAETIRHFLRDNRHAPISAQLRAKWLYHLAAEGDWETFINEYRHSDDDPELQCYRLRYLLSAGDEAMDLSDEIRRVWLSDKRLPAACNDVFRGWHEAGYLTEELIWTRIQRLMERGRLSLVRELADYYLDADERMWVRRWHDMHRDPGRRLEKQRYAVDTPRARTIVKYGIWRLANRDAASAMAQWQRLKQKYPSLAEDDDYILRRLGILAAQRHLPIALEWLSAVSNADHDPVLRLWRLRSALRAGEWQLAKRVVATLTEDEQSDRFWWYWAARIVEQTNEAKKARYLFAWLATERHYYGFLAADRIGVDYEMQHKPVTVNPERVDDMLARSGIQAARELYAIGDAVAARRQWGWAIRGMTKHELQAAALVARDWGWHDRAIYTLSRSGYRNDLDVRFPVLYRDLVESNAERHGLDPSWIYGVLRQESAFVVDARSSAGALGLMQLMPRVGRLTGRQLKLKIMSSQAILDVENNLRLGTAFLKNMLRRYDGHQMLATAAYNAGPNRVRSWLPQDMAIDADVWVETIPYDETRDYVKNVMAYTAVYDHRLKREPIRLCQRMPAVAPLTIDSVDDNVCSQLVRQSGTLSPADETPPESS
ncbi:MAG: transglycosylase SLT domain-containing protein [Acidiferrobacterales bacterium]